MRMIRRWTVVVIGSVVVFGASWYICEKFIGLDIGTSVGIAGVAVALALAVLSWWAVSTSQASPSSQISADSVAIVGDVPQQPPAYQSRDDLLATITQEDSQACLIHVLVGMRGVGKSQLAASFARQCIAEEWRLVAWINSDDPAVILDELTEAAVALGISRGEDSKATAYALRHELEKNGERCLIVFDNAVNADHLRPYLPVAGGGHIIITSIHTALGSLGVRVPVDVFTESQSLRYMDRRTGLKDEMRAKDLAAELGRLPLALAQAASTIAIQRIGYETYLHRLRTFPLEQYLARSADDPYPLRVATAILLTLQSVKANDSTEFAVYLMDLISLLSPTGVSRSLLYAACSKNKVSVMKRQDSVDQLRAADDALGQLSEASLLTFSVDGSAITCHRLTARVIRENAILEGALVSKGMMTIEFLTQMTSQVQPVWQHAALARELTRHIGSVHIHLAPVLDEETADIVINLLHLREWAIECLNQIGDNPTNTLSAAQDLLDDCERALGPDHPDTLVVQHSLAAAYRHAGMLKESIGLYERTLTERERIVGPNHPDTLTTQARLALSYREAGRLTDAINLYERNLAERERILGPNHPDTLTTLADLATVYLDAGKLEAIFLFERTLTGLEDTLGKDHPRTLTSRNNLAGAYQLAGRITEAVPLFETTLIDRQRILGEEHPDTLVSRLNLAGAYRVIGKIDDAALQCERTVKDCERILGVDHPNTLASRDTLADCYEDAGGIDKTIPLRERTLADCEHILGPDHPYTLLSRNKLARVYQKVRRLNEAIQLYEKNLSDRERILGPDHPDTIASRMNLSDARRQASDSQ
jgi:tetratricopeptide (TPR) repeat protein